jgi:hypothetical protein
MNYALRVARGARHKLHRHAALVFRGGALVSVGVNHDYTHAEVAAVNALWPSERRGTRVLSVRLRRNGTVGIARPCVDCQRYLRTQGVKSVDYTNQDGEIERMRL